MTIEQQLGLLVRVALLALGVLLYMAMVLKSRL